MILSFARQEDIIIAIIPLDVPLIKKNALSAPVKSAKSSSASAKQACGFARLSKPIGALTSHLKTFAPIKSLKVFETLPC